MASSVLRCNIRLEKERANLVSWYGKFLVVNSLCCLEYHSNRSSSIFPSFHRTIPQLRHAMLAFGFDFMYGLCRRKNIYINKLDNNYLQSRALSVDPTQPTNQGANAVPGVSKGTGQSFFTFALHLYKHHQLTSKLVHTTFPPNEAGICGWSKS